ncbi:MAG: (d)CMP kinase [Pseudomonadota bacterium]
MTKPKIIITIDGPAGAGKSTITRLLAQQLGLDCLDTGAMYRVVAWVLREEKKEEWSGEGLALFLKDLDFTIEGTGPAQKVRVDGLDVSQEIRTPEISQLASAISMKPEVRSFLAEKQKAYGSRGGLIAEGRDMGTVIFPQADYKFFLEASLEVRAHRRFQELTQKGQSVSFEEVKQDMEARDRQDQERALAPLRPAQDAHVVNTTQMSIEEVVKLICSKLIQFYPDLKISGLS